MEGRGRGDVRVEKGGRSYRKVHEEEGRKDVGGEPLIGCRKRWRELHDLELLPFNARKPRWKSG